MDEKERRYHEKWMAQALGLAKKALAAGQFPVGCVLVSQDEIVGVGSRLNSNGALQNELDHAEILALRDWVSRGRPGQKVIAYSTLEPCLMCAGALLISGIRSIVFGYEDVMGGACGLDKYVPFSASKGKAICAPLYRDAQVKVIPGILRNESLALFKAYFNKNNNYLKNTLLEEYTLKAK